MVVIGPAVTRKRSRSMLVIPGRSLRSSRIPSVSTIGVKEWPAADGAHSMPPGGSPDNLVLDVSLVGDLRLSVWG